jgi:hypothetical protein
MTQLNTSMEKLLKILKELITQKFTGKIEINFNQGGIRGIKKVKKEIVNL